MPSAMQPNGPPDRVDEGTARPRNPPDPCPQGLADDIRGPKNAQWVPIVHVEPKRLKNK